MRWLSPPDSVPEARARVRYSRPDVDEEAQALADLLEDAAGDLVLLRVRLGGSVAEPGWRVAHRERRRLADVEAGDLHRQRLGLQAVPSQASQGVSRM